MFNSEERNRTANRHITNVLLYLVELLRTGKSAGVAHGLNQGESHPLPHAFSHIFRSLGRLGKGLGKPELTVPRVLVGMRLYRYRSLSGPYLTSLTRDSRGRHVGLR